jgi:hypothetical protein
MYPFTINLVLQAVSLDVCPKGLDNPSSTFFLDIENVPYKVEKIGSCWKTLVYILPSSGSTRNCSGYCCRCRMSRTFVGLSPVRLIVKPSRAGCEELWCHWDSGKPGNELRTDSWRVHDRTSTTLLSGYNAGSRSRSTTMDFTSVENCFGGVLSFAR